MIELVWKVIPEVNKHLLQLHLDIMQKRSSITNTFAIQLPIAVFNYIEAVGINAEFYKLNDNAMPGMIWTYVRKIKPHESTPCPF